MGLSLMNMFGISSSENFAHITCYWKFLLRTIYKSYISTGFTEQIISNLRILCYNGSIFFWKVVSLNTTKFKPLIFYWLQLKTGIRYIGAAWTTPKTSYVITSTVGVWRHCICAEVCLPSRYVEAGYITSFHYCVRVWRGVYRSVT
jgi:hypothetical protein